MKNGKLLALAAMEFDAFITVDKNLPYQQNISALSVALVVLDALSNELSFLRPLIPALERRRHSKIQGTRAGTRSKEIAKTTTRVWDRAEHLHSDEDMAAYLGAARDEGDAFLLAAVLEDIARAKSAS